MRQIIGSVEEFKKRVAIGDTIYSASYNKPAVVTAIGRDRFLYINYMDDENVGTMSPTTMSAKWLLEVPEQVVGVQPEIGGA